MLVIFKEPGLKRVGQKRVEVAAGQVVSCEWADLARYQTDAYEIVREPQPEPEPEPEAKRPAQRRGAASRTETTEGE